MLFDNLIVELRGRTLGYNGAAVHDVKAVTDI
jgi:hypothetical protein